MVKPVEAPVLVTHKLSGLVAHDLSGSHRTPGRGAYENRTEWLQETRLMRFEEAFKSIRSDMAGLSERMARVEGMIDGLREAIAARIVA